MKKAGTHEGRDNRKMSKKTTPVTHDATFKAFLTHPDTARDFIKLHVLAEFREICDLSTLKLE